MFHGTISNTSSTGSNLRHLHPSCNLFRKIGKYHCSIWATIEVCVSEGGLEAAPSSGMVYGSSVVDDLVLGRRSADLSDHGHCPNDHGKKENNIFEKKIYILNLLLITPDVCRLYTIFES